MKKSATAFIAALIITSNNIYCDIVKTGLLFYQTSCWSHWISFSAVLQPTNCSTTTL